MGLVDNGAPRRITLQKQAFFNDWSTVYSYPLTVQNRDETIETRVWYEGVVATLDGETIPCMNLRRACASTPDAFTRLANPQNKCYWVLTEEGTEEGVKHAGLVSYFEETDCPITMRPLTLETACLTSCCHLFEHIALLQWLETRNQCPLCRTPICEEELLT